jgi:hypothetical protein
MCRCKIYLIKRAKKIPRNRCPGKFFGKYLKNGNFSGKKGTILRCGSGEKI